MATFVLHSTFMSNCNYPFGSCYLIFWDSVSQGLDGHTIEINMWTVELHRVPSMKEYTHKMGKMFRVKIFVFDRKNGF